MNAITANTVADFFLCFAREHGDVLTPLKLQKLVYYAQAWHLALKGKPLFDEKIEAWIHGPVVRSVFTRFKKYSWRPIDRAVKQPSLSGNVKKFLCEIFSVYGGFSAWDLERMTHKETPWLNARVGLAVDQEGTQEISRSDMKEFYGKLAAQ
jgi:uncharacterized phage-associated protein